MEHFLLTWGILIISAAANAFGAFVIKMNLNAAGPAPVTRPLAMIGYFFSLLRSPLVVFGVLLFFASPFLYSIALSRMEVSIAQPAFVGLNFSLLVICATTILRESWTWRKGLGMVLVVAGLACLHYG